jgi:hypothetical protein
MQIGVSLSLTRPKTASAAINLLTNGDFSAGTSGWTLGSGVGTLTNVAGQGVLTITTTGALVYSQAIATVIGRTYSVSGTIIAGTGTFLARKGDDAAFNSSTVEFGTNTVGDFTGTFVATATTTYFGMQTNGNAGQGGTFDNLSVT